MTATRPLPGVFFRTEPAARVSALPRMDIAAFVGFAARGPLHTPVLIEDVAHLREVFGEAPLLAWDREAAAWQSACLVPEVQDFFSGGGRRCWVVRVAGEAVCNKQPVAGLLRWDETGLSPAEARARCAGSWSDGLQVGASLEQEPLRVEPAVLQAASRLTLRLGRLRGEPIQPGDLLQLDCDHPAQPRAYLAVESAADVATPPGQQGRWQAVSGAAQWFRPLARDGAALTGDVHKPGDSGVVLNATFDPPSLRLTDLPDNYAVERGDWLSLTSGATTAWLLAGEFGPNGLNLLGAWHEGAFVAGTLLRAARLTLRLATRNTLTDARDGTDARTLSGLAYCASHPRAWSRLPDDEALYERHEGEPDDAAVRVDAPLWLEASKPRFPLAGPLDTAPRYLPLGLIGLPVAWRGSPPSSEDPMARDGLFPAGESLFDPSGQAWAKFLRAVHLDPDLGDLEVHAVLADAMDKRFVRKEKLLGLHSTVSLEEVSIVALPDASQRGWRLVEHEVPVMPEPQPPDPPQAPDPCVGHELFEDCEPADQTPEVPTPNPPPPRVAPPFRRWELIDRPSYDASGLIEVQEAATKLAAARGDQLVVLGLPSHYRPLQALDHRRYLGADFVRDDVDASYATLYHPWYVERTQSNALRRIGPEGAAAGIMASRALYRGAWVAPANEVVKDALQIVLPASDSERLDLYNAGVNVLSMDPRGAVLMSSETLSYDPLWTPINVRRLIILLRRLCLREGTDYVFEPDSPAFRRRVNLAFEAVLADLFKRGAFAGSTPDQAFQVVTDDSINTEQSLREGRFIVELKVAPSQPMAFITVRLVQTGPGAVVVQQV